MIAFSDPRGAVEWAVLLQLALLRYATSCPLTLTPKALHACLKSSAYAVEGLVCRHTPLMASPPPPIYPPGAPVGATLSAGTLNMHSSCNVTLQACCFVKHADMVCQHVETALAGTGGCRILAAFWWLHKPPPTPPPTPPAYTFDPKQFRDMQGAMESSLGAV